MSTNDVDSQGEVNKRVENHDLNKEVVFDSKDIGKKEKTDYFVRVEGAEERKKEVIRRMQQQKNELIREEKAKAAAAKKDEDSRKRAARHQKIADTFWTGRRKAITITVVILILALAIGGPFLWKDVISPLIARQEEEAVFQESVKSGNEASEAANEAIEKLESGNFSEESYSEVKNEFEQKINDAKTDADKIYLAINYAAVLYEAEGNGQLCAETLEKYENLVDGEIYDVRLDFYATINMYYGMTENEEKKQHYSEIVKSFMPPDEDFVVPAEELKRNTQKGAEWEGN